LGVPCLQSKEAKPTKDTSDVGGWRVMAKFCLARWEGKVVEQTPEMVFQRKENYVGGRHGRWEEGDTS